MENYFLIHGGDVFVFGDTNWAGKCFKRRQIKLRHVPNLGIRPFPDEISFVAASKAWTFSTLIA